MSLEPNSTVATLLKHATTPAIRRSILQAGCPDLVTAISKVERRPASLRTYGSDDAIAIVSELTNPETLTNIAGREKRLGVWDAIQYNVHTPEEIRRRAGVPVPAATRNPLPTGITTTESLSIWLNHNEVALTDERLLQWLLHESPEPATFLKAYATGAFGRVYGMTLSILQHHEDILPLEEFYNLTTGRTSRMLLNYALGNQTEIGVSLVKLAQGQRDLPYDGRYTPGALQALAASTRTGDQGIAVARGALPEDEAVEVFRGLPAEVQAQAIINTVRNEHKILFAEHLTYSHMRGHVDPAHLLGEALPYTLQGRLNILRWASAGEIIEYLSETTAVGGRDEDITPLLDLLLGDDTVRYCDRVDWIQGLQTYSGNHPRVLQVIDQVIAQATGITAMALTNRYHGSDYALHQKVSALLYGHCGENAQRWEMLLTLGPTWEGTLPELLDLMEITTG